MPKYYAWSRVRTEEGIVAKPGDEVDAAKLKLGKDDFQELVDSNAVRTEKYPDIGDYTGSPREYMMEQIAHLGAGTGMLGTEKLLANLKDAETEAA